MTDVKGEGTAATMLKRLEDSQDHHHMAWECARAALKGVTWALMGVLALVGSQIYGSIELTRTEIPKLQTAVVSLTAAMVEVKGAVEAVKKEASANHLAVERIQQTHRELYEHRFAAATQHRQMINRQLDQLEVMMREELRRTREKE